MIIGISWALALLLCSFAMVRGFREKLAGERNPNTDMIFFTGVAMFPLGAIVATIAAVLV